MVDCTLDGMIHMHIFKKNTLSSSRFKKQHMLCARLCCNICIFWGASLNSSFVSGMCCNDSFVMAVSSPQKRTVEQQRTVGSIVIEAIANESHGTVSSV